MTNIIYNEFLQEFFSNNVDLLAEDTYKIALFKEDYTPNADEISHYEVLSLAGVECVEENENYSDNPHKGYKAGGKYIKFSQPDPSKTQYSCGEVQWDYINISQSDNLIRYAFIYRESDGLPICCFPMDTLVSVGGDDDLVGDTLVLSWKDTITLSIDATNSISIDADFSHESTNALQNKAITDKIDQIYSDIEKYGVKLNGEDYRPTPNPDENPSNKLPDDDDDVDALDRIPDEYIDHLFD